MREDKLRRKESKVICKVTLVHFIFKETNLFLKRMRTISNNLYAQSSSEDLF